VKRREMEKEEQMEEEMEEEEEEEDEEGGSGHTIAETRFTDMKMKYVFEPIFAMPTGQTCAATMEPEFVSA
jgi:hypothetical protein